MPGKKHNELKAGLFVVFALMLLVGVVMWIGSISIIDNVSSRAWFCSKVGDGPVGLKEKHDVQFGDHKVGEIRSIVPDYNNGCIFYEVEFTEKNFDIYADGKAGVNSGMLGGSVLVISSIGSKLKGETSQKKPIMISPGGMQAAMNGMQTLSKDLLAISEGLKKELDGGNKISLLFHIKTLVTNLQKVSGDLVTISQKLVPELDFTKTGTLASEIKKASVNLASTTTKLNEYTKKDLALILANVRKISTSLLETSGNLGTSSKELKELLVENSGSLDRMIDDMSLMASDLKATAREVRRSPWQLLYTPKDKELKEAQLFEASRAFENASRELGVVVTRLEALRKISSDDPAAKKNVEDVRKYMLNLFKEFRRVEEIFWKQLSEFDGKKVSGKK